MVRVGVGPAGLGAGAEACADHGETIRMRVPALEVEGGRAPGAPRLETWRAEGRGEIVHVEIARRRRGTGQ